jgi:hypothetical protein
MSKTVADKTTEILSGTSAEHRRRIVAEIIALDGPGILPAIELSRNGKESGGLSSVNSFVRSTTRPSEMDPAAYSGLPGDFVRTAEPHTESDPVALLLSFLTFVGNIIGPGPHMRVEGAKHGGNEFVLLVGESSRSRKGTSRQHVTNIVGPTDPDWRDNCIGSGLGSGEGIGHYLQDGEAQRDRRLLLMEGEFAAVLRRMDRKGCTISSELRNAWDGIALQSIVKNDRYRASGIHLSLLAHITSSELMRELDATDAENGFLNRFLIHVVGRSKSLPFGGDLSAVNVAPLISRIRSAVDFARTVDELRWDESGREVWEPAYKAMTTEDVPGIAGAVMARLEAHAIRLSVLYALCDLSESIMAEHVESALAVVEHSRQSILYLFADRTGNVLADRCLEHIRAHGRMSRSDLHNALGGHVPSRELKDAVAVLARLFRVRIWDEETGGRPRQMVEAL